MMDRREVLLDDLLRRIFSSDPQIHQAALVEILQAPDTAVETLLDLLACSTPDRRFEPQAPFNLSDLQALAAMLPNSSMLEPEFLAAFAKAQAFRDSFRQPREVILDLRRALVSLGRPAWIEMLALAQSTPERYATHVEYAMLDFKAVVIIDDVLGVLEHPQARIRQRAIYMLAQFGDPRAVSTLLGLLYQSTSISTREAAAGGLAHLGKAGADALWDVYQGGNAQVRREAIDGLMQSGDPRALDIALEWLLTSNHKERLRGQVGLDRMLSALAEEDLPRVLDALIERLRQGNENNFSPVSQVIAKLGQRAVEPMRMLLADTSLDAQSSNIRLYALDALARIDQIDPASLGSSFPGMLKQLIFERNNPYLAASAARLLGRFTEADTLHTLLSALEIQRDDPVILTSIVVALGQHQDQRALPPLDQLRKYWQAQPSNFEAAELIDEINGALERIESGSQPE